MPNNLFTGIILYLSPAITSRKNIIHTRKFLGHQLHQCIPEIFLFLISKIPNHPGVEFIGGNTGAYQHHVECYTFPQYKLVAQLKTRSKYFQVCFRRHQPGIGTPFPEFPVVVAIEGNIGANVYAMRSIYLFSLPR